jgi:HK97 family phage portal protein
VSLLSRALARHGPATEKRSTSTLAYPSDELFESFAGYRPGSKVGRKATVETAQRYSNVFACMRAISEGAALCPILSYRRAGADRMREEPVPGTTAGLLTAPLPWMPLSVWIWTLLWDMNSWGEAYFAKLRAPSGKVNGLMRIHPRRVYPYVDAGEKRFRVAVGQTDDGFAGERDTGDILHIFGLSADGICGLSPIAMTRTALGLGITMEEFVGLFVDNGITAGYVLTTDQRLTAEAAKRMADDWKDVAHGVQNAGDTVVLEQGLKPQQLGLPLRDAQFIEQRQYTATETARIFRVPPWMIAANSNANGSIVYSNVEQENLFFATYSLSFWFRAIEGHLALDPDLYPLDRSRYPEFLMDALLRSDSLTRAKVYALATGGRPWMKGSEVRPRENLPTDSTIDDLPAQGAPAAAHEPQNQPGPGGAQ